MLLRFNDAFELLQQVDGEDGVGEVEEETQTYASEEPQRATFVVDLSGRLRIRARRVNLFHMRLDTIEGHDEGGVDQRYD